MRTAFLVVADPPDVRLQSSDPPSQILAHLDGGRSLDGAEKPGGPGSVLLRIVVGRDGEVAGLLSAKTDDPLDPAHAEGADALAFVVITYDVPTSLNEEEVVRLEGTFFQGLYGGGVVEANRFAPVYRVLQAGQLFPRTLRVFVGGEGHRQLFQLVSHRVRPAMGDRREGKAQGPRIGESTVECGQAYRKGAQLGRREVDLGKMEVFRGQKVELSFGHLRVRDALDIDADAAEIGAVAEEAARERIFAHLCVTLDRLLDLAGRERARLAQEERYQRQLAYQLVLVTTHAARLAHKCQPGQHPSGEGSTMVGTMDGSLDCNGGECEPGLILVLGPPNSGKMGHALDWWRERLPLRPIVVGPTGPDARELTSEMVRRTSALVGQSPALTFDGLVGAVTGRPSRQPGEFEHRLMVGRLLRETPLHSLSGTAFLPGAGAAVARLLHQLGESGKDPNELYQILSVWARDDPSAAGLATDIRHLHKAYLDACATWGLTDGPTAAREAVVRAAGWTRPVVLYGFTSFTAVQRILIEGLSRAAPVLVTLSHDPTRPANLSTSAEVDGWRKKAVRVVELLPEVRAYSSPSIAYLERHFMSDRPLPEPPRPTEGPEGVRFLLASGQRNEVELVAQQISGLLRGGFRPGDIAVVVRRLRGWSSLLRQVFDSCGIPYHIDDVLTLGETGLGHALLRGARGVLRDDAEALLVYLRSPYSGLTPEMVADLELRYRRGGRQGVAVLTDIGEDLCPGSLAPLWGAIGDHPDGAGIDPAGLENLCRRMLGASAQLGIVDDRDFEEDARAFRALGAAASVMRAPAATGFKCDRLEAEAVLQALAGISIPGSRIGAADAVQILDVRRARARRFPVVVVLGLVEGEFPGHSDPPALLTRDQRIRLDSLAGGSLFVPETNQEAGLFLSALSRAWQLLLLSARDADDGGGEVLPSRFWSLSRELLGTDQGDCETRTLAEVVFRMEAAPSLRDYLRACAAQGCSPHPDVPGGAGRRHAPAWRRAPARLTDRAILEELADTQSFSPSSLEAYLNCPFAWFVDRVIGVEELEPELDARATGQLFHSVLSIIYRELASRDALPVRPESLAEARLLAFAVIERLVGEDGCPGVSAEKRLAAWRLRRDGRKPSPYGEHGGRRADYAGNGVDSRR